MHSRDLTSVSINIGIGSEWQGIGCFEFHTGLLPFKNIIDETVDLVCSDQPVVIADYGNDIAFCRDKCKLGVETVFFESRHQSD